ncbi:MAG TPA: hypothetical protein PLB02_15725, partial [Thermoanaerobaculia bacterium]|nr:hypothetical protein [Thermoanaerobaculia bacterium]
RATGPLLLGPPLAGGARAVGPAPTPTPTPSPAARADRSWEGMVRRQKGLAIAGRWRPGTLAFKEETFRWSDAKDPGRNLVLPAGRIVSHRRVCRDPGAETTCFEWSLVTQDGETYVYRDDGGSDGPGTRIREIFVFFQAILPAVPSETVAGAP